MEQVNIQNSDSPLTFEFSGTEAEYFPIWIVNVLLTILTLGIYSAWAKVRTKQYFYGSTYLDGVSFRYLADPKKILKGRLIAFGAFFTYFIAGMFSPFAALVIIFILMALAPAIMVLSMSFSLRNSAYRNLVFHFNKDFKGVYQLFAIPILFVSAYFAVITIGFPEEAVSENRGLSGHFIVIAFLPLAIVFLVPWFEFLITQFRVNHTNFGDAQLKFSARIKNYYGMYIKGFLGFMLWFILFGFLMFLAISALGGPDGLKGNVQKLQFIPFVLIFPLYLWIWAYFQTKRTNLIFNNIEISGHKLQSKLKTSYMLYLYITNTLAMVVSLGLFMPWAKIRTARYKASVTALIPNGELSNIMAVRQQNQSALGEEMGDMFDMDFGL